MSLRHVSREAKQLSDPTEPAVTVDDLSFAYRSKNISTPVLKHVSLSVKNGEWVAIMGPSGSGKSTLLLCAAGIQKADARSIRVAGTDVVRATEKRLTALRRDRLGFIFQDFNLIDALTVADNVDLPARFGGKRHPRRDLLAALKNVGLETKASIRPDELSGGQRQRVAIARAMVAAPVVVFADEPTGSLDVANGDRVMNQLQGLVKNGTAVVMVTHDPRVAARADRVVFLSDGRSQSRNSAGDCCASCRPGGSATMKTPRTLRVDVALDMLRHHRSSYRGLVVVTCIAATVVASSLMVGAAARNAHVDTSTMNDNQVARSMALLESGRSMSSLMVTIATVVSVFLVAQTMGFVVEGRRQELAQLRLLGATPWQVIAMVATEALVISVVSSAASGILALALVRPYARILTTQGNWLAGIIPGFDVSALIGGVLLMIATVVVGALLASRRIARMEAADAVKPIVPAQGRMSPAKWLVTLTGAVVVLVFLLLPPTLVDPQVTTIAVGGGGVLLASAVVPLVIPLVAGSLGRVFVLVAPAAGLVARRQVAHHTKRGTALAVPIIVVLGLGFIFAMMAQTGRAAYGDGFRQLNHVDAVKENPLVARGEARYQAARAASGIKLSTRIQVAEDFSWAGPQATTEDWPVLMGIEPGTFAHFVPAAFTRGSAADIRGHDVAVVGTGIATVGEKLYVESGNGTTTELTVRAQVEPTSFLSSTLIVDSAGLDLGSSGTDTWLVQRNPGSSDQGLLRTLNAAGGGTETHTMQAWVKAKVEHSVRSQRSAIFTLVGGAGLLAMVSLTQTVLTSLRERSGELELLSRIGARRWSVVASTVIEVVLVVVSATMVAMLVAGVSWLRMKTVLDAQDAGLTPVVPVSILVMVFAGCLAAAVLSAAAGARVNARSWRLSHEGRRGRRGAFTA